MWRFAKPHRADPLAILCKRVHSGQYAVFGFPFEYKGEGRYELNIEFSSDGLIATDTTENNYSVELTN